MEHRKWQMVTSLRNGGSNIEGLVLSSVTLEKELIKWVIWITLHGDRFH